MVISTIKIVKFRAFSSECVKIGKNLTAICGMNGTQKTTLLGLLSQPFTISDGPLFGEKTIDGYNFRSQFQEKFKLSKKFDKPGTHEWTLQFCNNNIYNGKNEISIVSSSRKSKGKIQGIRFINKEGKTKGKGYAQIPVVYLSLSRLFPIGESGKIKNTSIKLDKDEQELYLKYYKRILSIKLMTNPSSQIKIKDSKHIFAGVSDSQHDLEGNSSGETNIGRILLALLSFRRLKNKYPKDYKSGILLIDEIDTTLFAFAQKKIVEVLNDFSSKFNIQIIFTTHSTVILGEISKLQNKEIFALKDKGCIDKYKFKNEIIFLSNKYNNGKKIINLENLHSPSILKVKVCNMNLEINENNLLVNLYLEDEHAKDFFACLFNRFGIKIENYIRIINVDLGWTNYLNLIKHNVPEFINNLIVLDNDVLQHASDNIEFLKKQNNVLFLPVTVEKDMFKFLKDYNIYNEFNEDILIPNGIEFPYDVCFSNWVDDDFNESYDSETYKQWFENLVNGIGDINMLYNFWVGRNKSIVDDFKNEFIDKYNETARKNNYDLISANE